MHAHGEPGQRKLILEEELQIMTKIVDQIKILLQM